MIAPSVIKSSSSGRGRIAISKTAPSWIARFKAALSWNSISTVASCARSNSGTSSRSSGRMAPPLRILIFVAIGEFYFGFHGVKAEIDATARLYQCAAAIPCWSRRSPDRLRALRRNCHSERPCRINDSGTCFCTDRKNSRISKLRCRASVRTSCRRD